MMDKKRTDAERRARQCERLSRLLRVVSLILGPGRWNADALARELECSRRTVYRVMQTLSMAGVPWYYDEGKQAFCVRSGFRFPGLTTGKKAELAATDRDALAAIAKQLTSDGEKFLDSVRGFLALLEGKPES